jgi:hypothetical protein
VIAPFGDSPWLNGFEPKDIAPLIFVASKRRKCIVAHALHNNEWVCRIKMDATLAVPHIHDSLEVEEQS